MYKLDVQYKSFDGAIINGTLIKIKCSGPGEMARQVTCLMNKAPQDTCKNQTGTYATLAFWEAEPIPGVHWLTSLTESMSSSSVRLYLRKLSREQSRQTSNIKLWLLHTPAACVPECLCTQTYMSTPTLIFSIQRYGSICILSLYPVNLLNSLLSPRNLKNLVWGGCLLITYKQFHSFHLLYQQHSCFFNQQADD